MYHFIIICEFKLELQSGNGSVGLWPLWPWPLTSDLDLLHGPYPGPCWYLLKMSWWYDDGNIVKNVWQTDRRTENSIHRAAWSQLKTDDILLKIMHLLYIVIYISMQLHSYSQSTQRSYLPNLPNDYLIIKFAGIWYLTIHCYLIILLRLS